MEDVWKWLGFSTKATCRRVLERHFKEDTDYKISELALPFGKGLKGGQNRLDIQMTVRTFKHLCLVSNTDKAKTIHRYYLKLEKVMNEIVIQVCFECREEVVRLKETISELQDKYTVSLSDVHRKSELYNLLNRDYEKLRLKHNLLKERREYYKFERGPCFYLIADGWRHSLHIKFGISDDLNTRLSQYRTSMPQLRVLLLIYMPENKAFEIIYRSRMAGYMPELNHEYITGLGEAEAIHTATKLLSLTKLKGTIISEEQLDKYNAVVQKYARAVCDDLSDEEF